MNGKHHIGKRVDSVETYDVVGPITGVAVVVDSENEYQAGDQTGYVLEIECPYGTQTMANDILASVQNKKYSGFRATGAALPYDAELGDGVTVDGVYSMLAYRNVAFGPSHRSEIAAPGENVVCHEYSIDTQQKKIERKLAQTRSLISKTAEEILLEVSGKIGSDEASALISTAISGITLAVTSKDGSTTFKLTGGGAELSTQTLKLSVDAANITGSLTIGQLPSTVAETSDIPTSSDITTIVKGTITTGYVNALGISVTAANVSGTLSAGSLSLDGLLPLTTGGTIYGYMGVNTEKGGPVISDTSQSIFFVTTNNAAKMSYYEQKMIWVASGGCYSSETMKVYSDRRLKNNISYDLAAAEKLYPLLKPCEFRMNNDKDNKTHWGFIAQDFIEGAETAGLDIGTLAALGEYEGMYSIGYGEFTALNTYMIQKLMTRVSELERRLAE